MYCKICGSWHSKITSAKRHVNECHPEQYHFMDCFEDDSFSKEYYDIIQEAKRNGYRAIAETGSDLVWLGSLGYVVWWYHSGESDYDFVDRNNLHYEPKLSEGDFILSIEPYIEGRSLKSIREKQKTHFAIYKVIEVNERAEFGRAVLVKFRKVGKAEAIFKDGKWDVYEVIPEKEDFSYHVFILILVLVFFYTYYKFYIE